MRSQAEKGFWQYGHAPDGYAEGHDGGLRIAEGPARREEPGVDEINAEAFRAAVFEAWTDRSPAERRSALAQLLRRVTLTPGGVTLPIGDCHHEPAARRRGDRRAIGWGS